MSPLSYTLRSRSVQGPGAPSALPSLGPRGAAAAAGGVSARFSSGAAPSWGSLSRARLAAEGLGRVIWKAHHSTVRTLRVARHRARSAAARASTTAGEETAL